MNEKKFILYMAAAMMALLLIFLFSVCFIPMSPSGEKYADQIIIAVIGFLGILLGYFWGSSKSSADKSEELAKEAKAVK
jgi:hypothetical protein